MSPTPRTTSNLMYALVFLLAIPLALQARFRFEEGDWIAWGDTRNVYDFSVGREFVYAATGGGLLRWDRVNNEWLYPWLTVPGSFDEAIILSDLRKVFADKLTGDVYVKNKAGELFYRHSVNGIWKKVWDIPPEVEKRFELSEGKKVEPPPGLFAPHGFSIKPDNSLEKNFRSWKFMRGVFDENEHYLLGWQGYGMGVANSFRYSLELYPGGPGASPHFDLKNNIIWTVGNLDYGYGMVWRRDRNSDRWEFFDPDEEWGLTPARVTRLRVSDKGSTWLATNEGVMYRSRDRWNWLKKTDGLPANYIHDIVPFGEGAWVATKYGLAFINENRNSIRRPSKRESPEAAGSMFYRIAAAGDTLYAAGAGELLRYTEKEGFTRVELPINYPAGKAATVYYDGIYLAVADQYGFTWRDEEGKWHEALSRMWQNERIQALCFHGGYWWVGTNDGLVKYDPKYQDAILYREKDGLFGTSVSEIIGEDDSLWLGTNRALVRFRWYAPGRID